MKRTGRRGLPRERGRRGCASKAPRKNSAGPRATKVCSHCSDAPAEQVWDIQHKDLLLCKVIKVQVDSLVCR